MHQPEGTARVEHEKRLDHVLGVIVIIPLRCRKSRASARSRMMRLASVSVRCPRILIRSNSEPTTEETL